MNLKRSIKNQAWFRSLAREWGNLRRKESKDKMDTKKKKMITRTSYSRLFHKVLVGFRKAAIYGKAYMVQIPFWEVLNTKMSKWQYKAVGFWCSMWWVIQWTSINIKSLFAYCQKSFRNQNTTFLNMVDSSSSNTNKMRINRTKHLQDASETTHYPNFQTSCSTWESLTQHTVQTLITATISRDKSWMKTS